MNILRKYTICLKAILIAVLVISGIFWTGCSDDAERIDMPEGGCYCVKFALAGNPLTKAKPVGQPGKTAALDYEKKISNLVAVVFEKDSFYRTFSIDLGSTPSYSFDFEKAGNFDVYLVANVSPKLKNLLEQDLTTVASYESLVASQESGHHNMFLMSSEPFNVVVKEKEEVNYPTPISLVRFSSRFDIYNKVEGLVMTKITFQNRAEKSHMVLQNKMPLNALSNDKEYLLKDSQSKQFLAQIYSYENSDIGSASLLIEGTYNGKKIKPQEVVISDVPVKRNHLYSILITEKDLEDDPPGDSGKLTFNIIVQDWDAATHIVWDVDKLKDLTTPNFSIEPDSHHICSPSPSNPTNIAITTSSAHAIVINVTSKSAASKLEFFKRNLPDYLTIKEGVISYDDNKMVQPYILEFAENNTGVSRKVDIMVYNRFDKEKKRTFSVMQSANDNEEITYKLTVTPKFLSFAQKGGTKTLNIIAEKTIKTIENGVVTNTETKKVGWSSAIEGTGFSMTNNVVTATENQAEKIRQGSIKVSVDEHQETFVELPITQSGTGSGTIAVYTLAVKPSNLLFPKEGGSQEIDVVAKKTVITYENGVESSSKPVDADWVSSVEGDGFTVDKKIVKASANTSAVVRKGKLTISIPESPSTSRSVYLTQKENSSAVEEKVTYSLEVEEDQLTFASSGESKIFKVTALRKVTKYENGVPIDENETQTAWNATVSGVGFALNNGSLTDEQGSVTASVNSSSSVREGKLTISIDESPTTIKIIDLEQRPSTINEEETYSLTVMPKQLNFSNRGEDKLITVIATKVTKTYSNGNLIKSETEKIDNWESSVSGTGFTVSKERVTATENTSSSIREGYIIINIPQASPSVSKKIVLEQAAADIDTKVTYLLTVSDENLTFGKKGGSKSFNVVAQKTTNTILNGKETVKIDKVAWESSVSGSSVGFTVDKGTVMATENTSENIRKGTVKVSISESPQTTQNITLTQAGEKTSEIVTYALKVAPNSLLFENAGGKQTFSVLADKTTTTYENGNEISSNTEHNIAWTSSATGTGFSVNNNEVTATANSTSTVRKGEVTVRITESPSTIKTVALEQKAQMPIKIVTYELTAPDNLTFEQKGGSQSFAIMAKKTIKTILNGVETVDTQDTDWSAIVLGDGFNVAANVVTASENTSLDTRIGTVIVSIDEDQSISRTIGLNQAGSDTKEIVIYELKVDKHHLSFSSNGESKTPGIAAKKITKTYNNGSEIDSHEQNATWASEIEGDGFSMNNELITAAANNTGVVRKGSVRIYIEDFTSIAETVLLEQEKTKVIEEVSYSILVSPKKLSFKNDGGQADFNVEAKKTTKKITENGVEISSKTDDVAWISKVEGVGFTVKNNTVIASENIASATRTGKVRISIVENLQKSEVITLTQNGGDVNVEETYSLTVKPESLAFGFKGGTEEFTVVAEKKTITYVNGNEVNSVTDNKIAYVSKVSGTGFTVKDNKVTATENTATTSREGTVTVSIEEHPATSKTIVLKQAGNGTNKVVTYTLSVDPENLAFGSEGGEKGFTVVTADKTTTTYDNNGNEIDSNTEHDIAWTSTVSGAGFTVKDNKVSATENTATTSREGTVTVSIEEHPATTKTITLKQDAAKPITEITYELTAPDNLSFSGKGESKTIEDSDVVANKITKVFDNSGNEISSTTVPVDWTTEVSGDGFSIQNNVITALENTTGVVRQGKVTLKIKEHPLTIATINLVQKSLDIDVSYELSVSPKSLTFDSKGGTQELEILSKKRTIISENGNEITNVISDAAWSASVTGTGFSLENNKVTASENTATTSREGAVTVSIDEHPSSKVSVKLSQSPGGVEVSYELTVSPKVMIFEKEGGTKELTVSAKKKTTTTDSNGDESTSEEDVAWSAKITGSSNFTITGSQVTAKKNDSGQGKTGEIEITIDEHPAAKEIVSLGQDADAPDVVVTYSLDVQPDQINFGKEGGRQVLKIKGNRREDTYHNGSVVFTNNFDVDCSVSISGEGFSLNDKEVIATENTTSKERKGYVEVKINEHPETNMKVSINQAGSNSEVSYSLVVRPSFLTFSKKGGTKELTIEAEKRIVSYVNSEENVQIVKVPAMIKVKGAGGLTSNNFSVVSEKAVKAKPNLSPDIREATVTVFIVENPETKKEIPVKQAGSGINEIVNYSLVVVPGDMVFENIGGSQGMRIVASKITEKYDHSGNLMGDPIVENMNYRTSVEGEGFSVKGETVTAERNITPNEREGIVTVSIAGHSATKQKVDLRQRAFLGNVVNNYNIVVSPEKMSFPAQGGREHFSVNAKKKSQMIENNGTIIDSYEEQVPWSISQDIDWIALRDNDVNALPNNKQEERRGRLTIKIDESPSTQTTIDISQRGGQETTKVSYMLKIEPNKIEFTSAGGSNDFNVLAHRITERYINGVLIDSKKEEVDWTASLLQANPGESVFELKGSTITAKKNISGEKRVCSLRLYINENAGDYKTVEVIQAAAKITKRYEHKISADPKILEFPSEGGAKTFNVKATTRVRTFADGKLVGDVTEDKPWTSKIEAGEGFTVDKGKVTASVNTTTGERSGVVLVQFDEFGTPDMPTAKIDLQQNKGVEVERITYSIDANPDKLSFPATGGTKEIEIDAIKKTEIVINNQVIKSKQEKVPYGYQFAGEGFSKPPIGFDNGGLLVHASQNPTDVQRVGSVRVYIKEKEIEDLIIPLDQKPYILSTEVSYRIDYSPKSFDCRASGGETKEVQVKAVEITKTIVTGVVIKEEEKEVPFEAKLGGPINRVWGYVKKTGNKVSFLSIANTTKQNVQGSIDLTVLGHPETIQKVVLKQGPRPHLAIENVAEYNVGLESKTWAKDHGNASSGYYSVKVFTKVIPNNYHIPNKREFNGIFKDGTLKFASEKGAITEYLQLNGNNPQNYDAYYERVNSNQIIGYKFGDHYGAEGNKNHKDRIVTRYTRQKGKGILVEVIYVGNTILEGDTWDEIFTEAYWDNDFKQVIRRFFPMCGFKDKGKVKRRGHEVTYMDNRGSGGKRDGVYYFDEFNEIRSVGIATKYYRTIRPFKNN